MVSKVEYAMDVDVASFVLVEVTALADLVYVSVFVDVLIESAKYIPEGCF